MDKKLIRDAMLIILKDLGMIDRGSYRVRRLIVECPSCHTSREVNANGVRKAGHSRCQKCANKRQKADRKVSRKVVRDFGKEFVNKAVAVHGDKYNYTSVQYITSNEKVLIACPTHGEFEQRPNDHLKGYGCRKCSKGSFDHNASAILYYFKVCSPTSVAWKIGVTGTGLNSRYTSSERKRFSDIHTWTFETGAEAYTHEQSILKLYKAYKYHGKPLLKAGNTELFNCDIYRMATPLIMCIN